MKSLRLFEEGWRSLKCVACTRPGSKDNSATTIESHPFRDEIRPNDAPNRLLDEGNLLGLRAHVHACVAISSKTLQSGRELPVRPDTGSTGEMKRLYFTFYTVCKR